MKLKNFTLLACIGAIILVLEKFIYVLMNINIITYSEIPEQFFTTIGIFSFIAWLLIGLFFVKLYKNQK
jgi:hypothetical protein